MTRFFMWSTKKSHKIISCVDKSDCLFVSNGRFCDERHYFNHITHHIRLVGTCIIILYTVRMIYYDITCD